MSILPRLVDGFSAHLPSNIAVSLKILYLLILFFLMISLCTPAWPGTHNVAQTGHTLTEIYMLRLKADSTMTTSTFVVPVLKKGTSS